MPFCHLLATRFSSGCCSEQSDFQRLSWNILSPRQEKQLAWIQAATIISLYQSCLLPKQEVFCLPEECNDFVHSAVVQ
ncbi:hypothetical protein ATANTOWER_030055 [Ataeniobius toweri]|uniref:Uncharacterized protein n=1 Tax=Ataeniobius toweri TaxID=208326 RepID=A0ABU7ACP3_9TELE|nr:hypothetical protein [Ataeniobius toweri]